tara:strand:- start:268 stop:453 length:186 start_codon:yes stop_codon:yes gene_type:complete
MMHTAAVAVAAAPVVAKLNLGDIKMKITVERLKEIIKEELTAAEKDKKAELEKELDTLKHK